jgi:hypothetical protein
VNVFSSYRARRRFYWILGFTAIATGIAMVVLFVSDKPPSIGSNKLSSKPAVLSKVPKTRKLTRADRRAIDRTLDGFVRHAVARKGVEASYDLVTASLRGGISRSGWHSGSIPVYPYPARGTTFHHWTVDYSDTSGAGLELMLEPRAGAKTGPVVFDVDVKRAGKRWLVDSFTPAASFAPSGKKAAVTAAADFGAKSSTGGSDGGKARFSASYAYVPLLVFAFLLVILVAWFAVARVRARRAFREHRRSPKLPELPRAR